MGKPESVVRKFRFFLLALGITGVLFACASDSEESAQGSEESTPAVVASQTESTAPSNNSALSANTSTTPPVTNSPPVNNNPVVADINHIIVVTGQSNVEASDTNGGFDAALDQPHPRVFAFTDSGWQIADLHQVWDEHGHPGNHALTVPGRQPNNSFTFHFSKSLAQQDSSAIPAFIVLAAPGNGIANWDYESEFYLKMRNKITNALAQIPHRDTIDVMLWHQGESDWLFEGTSDINATEFTDKETPEYQDYYKIKLDNVIANFRSESWARGDMAFICGETRIAEGVNRRLMALNNNGDPNSGCVAATDLPFTPVDPTGNHFSAAGLRELGRRYMQKYLMIINNSQ